MEPFFQDFAERLVALHRAAGEAIRDLPAAALDWVPGEGMNSLAVLATHTAQSERYWVGVMGGGHAYLRNRADEFVVRETTAVALQTLLDNALAHSQQTLAELTLADLALAREPPAHQRPFVVAWSLLHALEHTAEHVGQMQLTRQLWEQQGG